VDSVGSLDVKHELTRALRVDTRDPMAVAAVVRSDQLTMFPEADRLFVPRWFSRVIDCFTGRNPSWQAVDVPYHDLEHTMQGVLCLTTLLSRRAATVCQPAVDEAHFELAVLAMLLHDTGYLKSPEDRSGTGAKYTRTHVERSCRFAAEFLAVWGRAPEEIAAVQRMIRCTGFPADVDGLAFASESERICGHAVGTADLVGQMAADDYVEKLPLLYREFEEGEMPGLACVDDLIRTTPDFWERLVRPRLEGTFGGLCDLLGDAGGNPYLDRIRANVDRIRMGTDGEMGLRF